MKIDPSNANSQNFGRRFLGGYKKKEVDQYLSQVSREWEVLEEKNSNLKDQLKAAEIKINRLEKIETQLLKAINEAEQTRHIVLEQSKKEAQVKVMAAESKAVTIINQANEKASNMLQDANLNYKIRLGEMRKNLRILENNYRVIDKHTDQMIGEMTKVMSSTMEQINKLAKLKKLSLLDDKIKKTNELIARGEAKSKEGTKVGTNNRENRNQTGEVLNGKVLQKSPSFFDQFSHS